MVVDVLVCLAVVAVVVVELVGVVDAVLTSSIDAFF